MTRNANLAIVWCGPRPGPEVTVLNSCLRQVQLAVNWYGRYNIMAAISGFPYFDRYLYSQKQPFLYSSFHHDVFFMQTWDSTFAEIRYCLFMICHKLQAFKIRGVEEASRSPIVLPSRDWHSDSISSSYVDGNRFTQFIVRYVFLEAQTYKSVKM